jgi:hypothetical protein
VIQIAYSSTQQQACYKVDLTSLRRAGRVFRGSLEAVFQQRKHRRT